MKTYTVPLCCAINKDASCTKCPWQLCIECWNSYNKAHPEQTLHPVNEVHDFQMKGLCIMSDDPHIGIDFNRADETHYPD